jgi:hypothetical protein
MPLFRGRLLRQRGLRQNIISTQFLEDKLRSGRTFHIRHNCDVCDMFIKYVKYDLMYVTRSN